MPHLSQGEITTSISTNLARGRMQSFSDHFTALWNSPQYTEGAEADAQKSGCVCVHT